MKKYSTIRRLFTLALTLALVMALFPAAPAMAAGYTVKIYPNSYTRKPTNSADTTTVTQRFYAYQIFKGNIDGEKYQTGDNSASPNDPPTENGLSDIEWGNGIKSGEYGGLLYALTEIDTPASEVGATFELLFATEKYGSRYLDALGSDYKAAYNDPSNWEPAKDGDEATDDDIGGELTDDGRELLSSILKDFFKNESTSLTLGSLFRSALVHEKYVVSEENKTIVVPDYPAGFTLAGGANVIALVLKDFTNPETRNVTLAKILTKVVAAKDGDNNYKYLASSPSAKSAWNNDGYWTVSLNEGGYYLIIDTYAYGADPVTGDEGTAQSDYIMAVFGDQEIYVKTYAPSVEKIIVNSDNGNVHGDDFDPGDDVTFQITGTLPENLDNYETYSYTFLDTMAAGLEYVEGSMKVYAVAPNSVTYLLEEDTGGVEGSIGADPSPNLVFHSPEGSGTAVDIVSFTDVKGTVKGTRVNKVGDTPGNAVAGDIDITADWKIVIRYDARLNGDAGINDILKGNSNLVTLNYSSSSINSESRANAIASVDYIYDFGINIEKKATLDESKVPGAGFTLTKKNTVNYSEVKYYAYSSDNQAAAGNIIWLSLADIRAYTGRNISDVDVRYTQLSKSPEYAGPLKEFNIVNWVPVFDKSDNVITENRKAPVYGNVTEYALFEKSNNTYYLYKWITEAELKSYLGVSSIDWESFAGTDGELGAAHGSYAVGQWGNNNYEGKYAVLLTDVDGKLPIVGLKDETYTLSEVIVPADFQPPEDKSIEFVAEYYSNVFTETGKTSGTLKNLYYVYNGEYKYIVQEGVLVGGASGLSANLEVYNDPFEHWLDTGGRGTALFYIGGGALLLGAVVLLVISRIKKKS